MDNSIHDAIKSRGFDEWTLLVYGRTEVINDLHAEDALYHRSCYMNYKNNKMIPVKHQKSSSLQHSTPLHQPSTSRKRGRPKDEVLDGISDTTLLVSPTQEILYWEL